MKPSKMKDDDADKMEVKFKKEAQLKTAFENIYKDILNQIVDLSSDFYPMTEMSHDDPSKKFSYEMQNAKPSESALLMDWKVEGIEENETDFWSMFLKDEHEDFLKKCQGIAVQCNAIEK